MANETEFKEGTGHHPKWDEVKLNADTVYPKYAVNPVAVPAKKK